jgi:F-type H+-transporting ATPase subunit b
MTPVLVLGEVAAHSEASASGGSLWDQLVGVLHAFGVNWPSFLAQMLSFCVVAWVLWQFAFKPVLATINERQRTIQSGLDYAEEMKTKLAAAQAESAALLKNAQTEATKIVDEARKTAKEFLDKQMVEATARANDTIAKAQQAIELEHKKMLADARSEIARLVVTTTERVLAKKLTDTDRAAYNDTATRELTSV